MSLSSLTLPYSPSPPPPPPPSPQSRIAVDYEFELGGRMEYESSLYYEDEAFGGEDLIVTNGYDAIPKNLMADAVAAGAQLKLKFSVSKVAHVSCTDNRRCVYRCTYVCITALNVSAKHEFEARSYWVIHSHISVASPAFARL